MGTAIPALRGC